MRSIRGRTVGVQGWKDERHRLLELSWVARGLQFWLAQLTYCTSLPRKPPCVLSNKPPLPAPGLASQHCALGAQSGRSHRGPNPHLKKHTVLSVEGVFNNLGSMFQNHCSEVQGKLPGEDDMC